jgi:hypothetical protein
VCVSKMSCKEILVFITVSLQATSTQSSVYLFIMQEQIALNRKLNLVVL